VREIIKGAASKRGSFLFYKRAGGDEWPEVRLTGHSDPTIKKDEAIAFCGSFS